MRRSFRSAGWVALAAAVASAAVATLLATTTTAVAKPVAAKAHKCLVMTGSGDPAFTRNFNPYAGGGLPTNAIAQGAFYEPLIVVPAGGRKTVPWLAWQLEVEQWKQDSDAEHRAEREMVRRHAAHRCRRRLQPHRRASGQDHGPDWTG